MSAGLQENIRYLYVYYLIYTYNVSNSIIPGTTTFAVNKFVLDKYIKFSSYSWGNLSILDI